VQEGKWLPVHYHVEFYEGRDADHPVYSMQSSMPLFSFAVGDKIDSQNWGPNNNLPTNKLYQIVQVTHLLWTIEDSHLSHKVLVDMTVVDRNK